MKFPLISALFTFYDKNDEKLNNYLPLVAIFIFVCSKRVPLVTWPLMERKTQNIKWYLKKVGRINVPHGSTCPAFPYVLSGSTGLLSDSGWSSGPSSVLILIPLSWQIIQVANDGICLAKDNKGNQSRGIHGHCVAFWLVNCTGWAL